MQWFLLGQPKEIKMVQPINLTYTENPEGYSRILFEIFKCSAQICANIFATKCWNVEALNKIGIANLTPDCAIGFKMNGVTNRSIYEAVLAIVRYSTYEVCTVSKVEAILILWIILSECAS